MLLDATAGWCGARSGAVVARHSGLRLPIAGDPATLQPDVCVGGVMSILSEVAEFIKSLIEIGKTAPVDKLIVVLLGTAAISAIATHYFEKMVRSRGRGGDAEPKGPTPRPEPTRELKNLERLKTALDSKDDELWRFHQSKPPIGVLDSIRASKMRVITMANLKGGVGKTTMTANLGAYFERHEQRVLLIDFDYQGSLTLTVSRAAEREETASMAHLLLTGQLDGAAVASPDRAMGPRLPRISLLAAGNELNRQENRMLMRWLLKIDDADPRYALAGVLASPEVLARFDVVIIDTPPRLTLATINALCASTHFIIPTSLNQLAVQNIGNFLSQTSKWFRQDLNPRLEFAGIIGTMCTTVNLNDVELAAKKDANDAAIANWGPCPQFKGRYVFEQHVPNTARFREDAGRDIAYLDPRAPNAATRETIDALGTEIRQRLKL